MKTEDDTRNFSGCKGSYTVQNDNHMTHKTFQGAKVATRCRTYVENVTETECTDLTYPRSDTVAAQVEPVSIFVFSFVDREISDFLLNLNLVE